MVTCQSSELGWEVTVELPADFLSLGRGSVTMYFTSCSCNCILSSHSSAMLLISCHIFYTCYFLLGFMSAYTLEADTENNCMYP